MTGQTQAWAAHAGHTTEAMRQAAAREHISVGKLRQALADGSAVLPHNPAHKGLKPLAVGRYFRTKVNANIGRSPERSTLGGELRKLQTALDAGADCIMDLSLGENLPALRRELLKHCPAPFGTVPIYEAISRLGNRPDRFEPQMLLDVIAEQAEQGVDFMTLHAGILRRHLPLVRRRKAGIVSRGGAIMAQWMARHNRENPLFERWDEVLRICRQHDVTISLGDGLRPGCLADAGDAAQFAELEILGKLVRACRRAGVQVMVEGPGHVPFHKIKAQVEKARRVCHDAPFYVLGPVVTDIAAGHDHIAAAIGATAAAAAGAALLCYVTPAEHLGLPDEAEVREGIIAFRIAAHAADIAKGLPGAETADAAMTAARLKFNWQKQFALALDPEAARRRFCAKMPKNRKWSADHCTMCGAAFCAMRISSSMLKKLPRV